MIPQEARNKTIQRFTNLLDGSVRPNITAGQIIDYYQALLDNNKPQVSMPLGNIERQFREAEIQADLDDEDDYYGFTL
jgi:hypothetical protein